MPCWKCHAALPTNSRFCPQCGDEIKYGGFIAYYGLDAWWRTLTDDDRCFIKQCSTQGMGSANKSADIFDHPAGVVNSSQTKNEFLCSYATWATSTKHYSLAQSMLDMAKKSSRDPIDLHFSYNGMIAISYKTRNEDPAALSKCEKYCKEDIALFPAFKKAWQKSKYKMPIFNLRIPSFERLIIIYETSNRYDLAINICKQAISYGLHDSTKGDFAGRLQRLTKKQAMANKKPLIKIKAVE